MSLLITILQLLGLIVVGLIIVAFAVRRASLSRSASKGEKAARYGIDAPSDGSDSEAPGRR